eukprot:7379695-Ditylum_brightwellii.AAC.1
MHCANTVEFWECEFGYYPRQFTSFYWVTNALYLYRGSVHGGTPVTISLDGEHVDLISHCKFGTAMVKASGFLNGTITCIAPSQQTAGRASLGISLDGVDFISTGSDFTYVDPPLVHSIVPQSGPETGGTAVTSIEGQWLSDEMIMCDTPAMKPGHYTLSVSSNGIDVDPSNISFEYYPAFSLR